MEERMGLPIKANDTRAISTDVALAKQYPDASAWALASFRSAAAGLQQVWPCTPDEERVRYYVWASRQVRQTHAALEEAWNALTAAFVTMGSIVEDLDQFERTGMVPTITDMDLASMGDTDIRRLADDAIAPPRPAAKALPAPRRPFANREAKRAEIRRLSTEDGMTQRDIAKHLRASLGTVNAALRQGASGKGTSKRGT